MLTSATFYNDGIAITIDYNVINMLQITIRLTLLNKMTSITLAPSPLNTYRGAMLYLNKDKPKNLLKKNV
jgi:hypothetical protein